ncbi:MAG: NAD-dependent epimerase/dehydratase family protein [Solirubrobacteraceae bacterium]
MAGRRVLITGVASPVGSALAARLAADPAVERVVGVDTRPLEADLAERIDLVAADLRAPDLGDRMAATGVDTVVHNDVLQMPEPGRAGASLHDLNVIGTLQLLTACQALGDLSTLVVRGSAAIYGSEPAAPAFCTEADALRFPRRTRFQRDVGELEDLVAGFARRNPQVACSVLRLQPLVARDADTAVCRWLNTPVAAPTVLGFDPRVQLLDAADAVGALHAAVHAPVRGAVNVASAEVAVLSRVLRAANMRALPIAGPAWGTVVGAARRAGGRPPLPPEVERWLRHGRVVDTARMREELGFEPRRSTLEAAREAAA